MNYFMYALSLVFITVSYYTTALEGNFLLVVAAMLIICGYFAGEIKKLRNDIAKCNKPKEEPFHVV